MEQAFAPVSLLAFATNMLLVSLAAGRPVQELVAYAEELGKLTLATSSVASINHFLGELFRLKAGITDRGALPRQCARHDLIAGHVDALASSSWSICSSICNPASCARSPCPAASACMRCRRCRRWRKPDFPASRASPSTASCAQADAEGHRRAVERGDLRGGCRTGCGGPARCARLEARGSPPEEFTRFLLEDREWGDSVKKANIKSSE